MRLETIDKLVRVHSLTKVVAMISDSSHFDQAAVAELAWTIDERFSEVMADLKSDRAAVVEQVEKLRSPLSTRIFVGAINELRELLQLQPLGALVDEWSRASG